MLLGLHRQRKYSTGAYSAILSILLLLVVPATAALRARHKCTSESNVAKVLGYHPNCVELIDGPTCTETSVQDAGCRTTRARNFTLCGSVLYNEVDDPETRRAGNEPRTAAAAAAAAPAAAAAAAVESGAGVSGAAPLGPRTFSHCVYAPKPPGAPCNTAAAATGSGGGDGGGGASGGGGAAAALPPAVAVVAFVCGGGGLRGMCLPATPTGAAAGAAAAAGAGAAAAAAAAPGVSPSDELCAQFSCSKGLCGPPVPINEGQPCGAGATGGGGGAAAAAAAGGAGGGGSCRRSVCRGGRCVPEAHPDGSACGPVGPCGAATCRDGVCVSSVQDDGVMCGPSTACADWVCQGGVCVEERRPDGALCWHSPGSCPRTCAAGRCVACKCGPAFAFWAGSQHLDGLQWTPFPVDLRENSFGGYFNLLPEELEIPPLRLPYNESAPPPTLATTDVTTTAATAAAATGAAGAGTGAPVGSEPSTAAPTATSTAPTAIVVCSGCRLGMKLRPGGGMVQDGALLTGSVGLAASPVRGGTYVALDVWLFPNATHTHLITEWNPWADLSPPPLSAPQRWGGATSGRGADLSQPTSTHLTAANAGGGGSYGGGGVAATNATTATTATTEATDGSWQSQGGTSTGQLPQPVRQHSTWAFVRRRPVHWGFTYREQVRSVFVGLHLTVAACSRAVPLAAAAAAPPSPPPLATPPAPPQHRPQPPGG